MILPASLETLPKDLWPSIISNTPEPLKKIKNLFILSCVSKTLLERVKTCWKLVLCESLFFTSQLPKSNATDSDYEIFFRQNRKRFKSMFCLEKFDWTSPKKESSDYINFPLLDNTLIWSSYGIFLRSLNLCTKNVQEKKLTQPIEINHSLYSPIVSSEKWTVISSYSLNPNAFISQFLLKENVRGQSLSVLENCNNIPASATKGELLILDKATLEHIDTLKGFEGTIYQMLLDESFLYVLFQNDSKKIELQRYSTNDWKEKPIKIELPWTCENKPLFFLADGHVLFVFNDVDYFFISKDILFSNNSFRFTHLKMSNPNLLKVFNSHFFSIEPLIENNFILYQFNVTESGIEKLILLDIPAQNLNILDFYVHFNLIVLCFGESHQAKELHFYDLLTGKRIHSYSIENYERTLHSFKKIVVASVDRIFLVHKIGLSSNTKVEEFTLVEKA